MHVYTKVPLIKETDKNLIIKLDSKATKVHLRPTILQDLIEFVNKISQCKSFVSNLSKENQVSNPNLFSLEITFDEFGLISYQRNREFFEILPWDAYNMLFAIAQLHGRTDKSGAIDVGRCH